MTALELMKHLRMVPPDTPVRFHVGWDDEPEIDSVARNFNHVLLGFDLPAERYEVDYRSER